MDDQDEVKDAFDRLSEAVETDVHPSGLHGVRSRSRGWSGRGPWIAAAAAAVILGVGVGAMALWPAGDATRIDAADAPSSPTGAVAAPEEARCGEGAYVYLEPSADDSQVESVRARLEQLGGSQEVRYLDQDATYGEFSRLFADQPQFVDAITAEELPTSFRVLLSEPWTAAEIEGIEAHPGVLRVEFRRDYCGQSDAPPISPNDPGITTSTQPAAPDGNSTRRLGRVWQHAPSEGGEGLLALVGGVLAYDPAHDCFLLESGGRRYPVIWPAGTTSIEGPAVRLPSGETVRLGDSVGGGGAMGGPVPDAFDIPDECLPDTGEIISFNVNEELVVSGP